MANILQWCSDAGSPVAATTNLQTILEDSAANTVTLISDSDAVPGDISGYDLMVVDTSAVDTDISTKLRDLDIGVLIMNGDIDILIAMEMVASGQTMSSGSTDNIDI